MSRADKSWQDLSRADNCWKTCQEDINLDKQKLVADNNRNESGVVFFMYVIHGQLYQCTNVAIIYKLGHEVCQVKMIK